MATPRSGPGICPFVEQIEGVQSFANGYIDRVGFCDHTAAGFYGTLRNAAFWNGAGVSVHFNIAQDGSACQTVNIFDTAFAQGRRGPRIRWPYLGDRNPNQLLISTEHEDKLIPNYRWSEAMYQTDLRIKRWCIEEVKRVTGKNLMRYGLDSLTGHYMFDDVNRRNCPGQWWEQEGRHWLLGDLSEPEPVPEPPKEEEGQMYRWGGIANDGFFRGRRIEQGKLQPLWARYDYHLPRDAKSVDLCIYLQDGVIEVLDGDGKKAGFAIAGGSPSHWRVFMNDTDVGEIVLRGYTDAVVDQIECLGYWR